MPEPISDSQDSLGDKLDPIVGLISRQRWYILASAFVVALGAIAVLYRLPNRYTSEATLFVVEQQVPQRYVTPTSTTELADSLPAMTQQVLSRNRLLQLVEQFDLFASQRKRRTPEEIDALMRQYINIEPLPPTPGHRDMNAFKISFTANRAILAQEVTSKLTSLFIEENLKTREEQARTTTNFLHEHLEAAREKLATQEGLLREFKTKYLGELPEQQQGNLAILNGAQLQLQNIAASIDRAQQQRVYTESLLNGYRRLVPRNSSVPGVIAPGPGRQLTPYQTVQSDLARLDAERAKLLLRVRPGHPDVIAIDREITAARALAASLKPPAKDPGEPVEPQAAPGQVASGQQKASVQPTMPLQPAAPVDASEADEDTSIAQLRSQLESNRVEIANLTKDEVHQKAIIDEYQRRLNLTPVREQELAGILRDYELSRQDYADLLGKEQQSELAMSLEKQQGGQQFRLVDPPSLPDLPSSPKRLKLSAGAVGAGIFLGLIVAVLMELRKPAFYTEKDVTRRFSVPLVVGLPILLTPSDERNRKLKRTFEWLVGFALVAAVLVAEAWVYRHP